MLLGVIRRMMGSDSEDYEDDDIVDDCPMCGGDEWIGGGVCVECGWMGWGA